jgi:hypothetical protein
MHCFFTPGHCVLLVGRYVVDSAGLVTFVFNDQFKAADHAIKALEAATAMKPAAAKKNFFGF